MSERPIWEIIGWGTRPLEPGDGPEVDDMLDWLTGPQDRNIKIEVRRQSKWGGSQIVAVGVSRGMSTSTFSAPVLLSALEAAVRAVAGES